MLSRLKRMAVTQVKWDMGLLDSLSLTEILFNLCLRFCTFRIVTTSTKILFFSYLGRRYCTVNLTFILTHMIGGQNNQSSYEAPNNGLSGLTN